MSQFIDLYVLKFQLALFIYTYVDIITSTKNHEKKPLTLVIKKHNKRITNGLSLELEIFVYKTELTWEAERPFGH